MAIGGFVERTSVVIPFHWEEEVERLFMFTPMRNSFHSRVERSDCHRAKVERNRLKAHVLRRMPNFHVDVAHASRAVFCCRTLIQATVAKAQISASKRHITIKGALLRSEAEPANAPFILGPALLIHALAGFDERRKFVECLAPADLVIVGRQTVRQPIVYGRDACATVCINERTCDCHLSAQCGTCRFELYDLYDFLVRH
jgi:hypothetical protein